MKELNCQKCSRALPSKELFSAKGRILCRPCLDECLAAAPPSEFPRGSVHPLLDPTVCAKCGLDGGTKEFRTISTVPLCDACSQRYLKYPLPAWVKLFLMALLLLGSTEFARNWRLLQAYFEMSASLKAYASGDTPQAEKLMSQAAAHLPEHPDLAREERFLHAATLLWDRSPTDMQDVLRQRFEQSLNSPPRGRGDSGP